LRREHSIAQAQRVTFTPASTKHADVIPFSANAYMEARKAKRQPLEAGGLIACVVIKRKRSDVVNSRKIPGSS
jgi:hypothetical protein